MYAVARFVCKRITSATIYLLTFYFLLFLTALTLQVPHPPTLAESWAEIVNYLNHWEKVLHSYAPKDEL